MFETVVPYQKSSPPAPNTSKLKKYFCHKNFVYRLNLGDPEMYFCKSGSTGKLEFLNIFGP